jgi:hypothetical protein
MSENFVWLKKPTCVIINEIITDKINANTLVFNLKTDYLGFLRYLIWKSCCFAGMLSYKLWMTYEIAFKSQKENPMNNMITQTLKLAAVVAMASFALTGCITQPIHDPSPADGSLGLINQEATSMGQVVVSASAKTSVAAPETGEAIIHPLTLDSACSPGPCFVREASFTFVNARGDTVSRERRDTIWLVDSAGNYMTAFHPLLAATIRHDRHVSKIMGDADLEVQFNTTLTWGVDRLGDNVGVWIGTVTGTFNGTPFSATFSGIKRPFHPGLGFGFPENGGIMHCNRGDFGMDMNFLGNGKAEVDVTNHRNGRTHHIEVNGGQETQQN